MAFIFDVVRPARQYKRGELYNEEDDLPSAVYDPSPEEDPNVTDSDDEDVPLKPYDAIQT